MPHAADQRRVLFEGDDIVQSIRDYLLSVGVAAMLCGVASRFLGKKGSAALTRVLLGVFLTVTVLLPLGKLDASLFDAWELDFSASAQTAVAQGSAEAQNRLAQLIKEQTQAYILHRAQQLGAAVTVTVEVSDEALPQPISVRIRGSLSAENAQKLRTIIAEELGIAKEDQQWT